MLCTFLAFRRMSRNVQSKSVPDLQFVLGVGADDGEDGDIYFNLNEPPECLQLGTPLVALDTLEHYQFAGLPDLPLGRV